MAFWVGFISIHRIPLPGQKAFWVGLFYPYETPAGANGFLGGFYFCGHNRESTHRIPLPGQMAFWVGFIFCGHNRESTHRIPLPGQKAFWVGFILSIRNPCRGKRHFGWGLFYPYVTPAGANGIFGGGDYSTHRLPLPGQMAFWVGFFFAATIVNLPIGYPCRGKWLFGWGLFYPYETPAGANGILGGFILSIRNPCRGKRHFGWGLFYP
jgi:hypothetical protein